jgi:zinc D-Ala-D-Ala dipeptidase
LAISKMNTIINIFSVKTPYMYIGCAAVAIFLFISCKNDTPQAGANKPIALPDTVVHTNTPPTAPPDSVLEQDNMSEAPLQDPAKVAEAAPAPARPKPRPTNPKVPTSGEFLNISQLSSSIAIDIRYATRNNFTKAKIYDCAACLLRPEAAKAIVRAHQALQKKGMGLKMYDCYRPRPYQQRLWDVVPNPNYVTPPAKGSMHSRGAAVDLTIVDDKGKELDMGTEYDFFGPEAHTDYTKLPTRVLDNRKLLRETLEAVGFKGIRTEWWHFSYSGKDYPLSDYVWPCE